jgi:hypothetical protein
VVDSLRRDSARSEHRTVRRTVSLDSIHTWTKRIPDGTTDRLQEEIRAAAAVSEWDAVDRYAQGLPPVERSQPAHIIEAQRRKPVNHRLHITLCVLTGGLWLPVYLPRRRAAARRR